MLLPKTRMRRSALAYRTAAAFILLLGIAAALYVYDQVDRSGRAHILERVATVAEAIPDRELAALTGTEDDLGTPAYEDLKSLLMRMRSVNHDARFLYLIGQNPEGELFFYADSEPAESADYSPPGQVYYEATPAMYAFFEDGKRQTEGPDRDRWGLWISGYAPVADESGEIIAMMGMDLPANRYLIDALTYAALPLLVSLMLVVIVIATERSRARELSYIEQKAEFLSIASHEIRTPLTGIRWAIEGLLSRNDERIDARTRQLLTLVHESCLGLIGRVNNLLDLTALEGRQMTALKKERIDAQSFLKDIADSLALSAGQRDIAIVLDPSIGLVGTFIADRQMMHHAFFNLLTNAIKYTHEHTLVTLSAKRADGQIEFRVSDQGDGIPEHDRERVFEGYHRTEEAVRSGQYGTGLGLYLTKRAAELHGGGVSIESTPGGGAVFVLSIPEAETIPS